jgi:hypothetical protein
MRSPRTARAAGLLACVALAGLLSACSSHDDKTAATTAASHGSEAGSGSVAAAVPGVGSAQQRVSAAQNNPLSVQTSKVLKRLTTSEVASYTVVDGTPHQARLAAAAKSVKGTASGVSYYHVTKDGETVADIGVYRFAPETSTSKTFQGQIVSQLVQSLTKTHKVKFDQVSGSLFTVAGKSPAAIGTFQGQSAIVVLGEKSSTSLAGATAAAFAYLRS